MNILPNSTVDHFQTPLARTQAQGRITQVDLRGKIKLIYQNKVLQFRGFLKLSK